MEDQTLPRNILLECTLTLPLGMRYLLSDTSTTYSLTPPTLALRPSPLPLQRKPLCLVLDLTPCPLKLQKLLRPSELCLSIPPPHSCQSPLPTLPTTPRKKVTMRFQCPNEMSLGMKTALAWHQEQLLLARKWWDLKNWRRVAIGHTPSTPPLLISHLVHNAENPESTVTNTTHQSPSLSPSSLSPSPNPFALSAWRHLASTVKKPRHWQVDLPLPSDKVVKIPLQFCLPIPSKNTLPKGWVYVVKDVVGAVKQEATNLLLYNSVDRTLTCTQHTCLCTQKSDPYCCHCRATSTTAGLLMSPSTSSMNKESRPLHNMSKFI
jgi:hypothetical protein